MNPLRYFFLKPQTAFVPFGFSCQNNANSTTTFQSGDETNLIGSQIIGKAVKGDVGGNLNIRSLQDKSTYDAKQTSAGVSVSICVPPICAGASSISGSFGQDKTHANYASVKEVAGIYAGDGGFDVNVKGQTELTGAVIASTAAANQNHLKTGTLQTHELHNQSDYKASSLNVSASYSGKETTKQTDAQGNTTIVPKQAIDKNGAPVQDSNGNPVQAQSGIKGMNASLPSAMQAADSASSVTQSGISQGAIELTSNEQGSANALANLNRNVDTNRQTAAGLDNLYQRDKDKIAQGFEITRQLAQNANTFMNYMAKDLDAARAEKAALQTQSQAQGNAPILAPDGTQATLADGTPLTIKDLNDPAFNAAIAANPQLGQARDAYNQTNQDLAKAEKSYDTRQALWGSGGYGSMLVTGLVGAASGNVTGSGAALLQNSAINVVRQLGAQQIKGIADGFMDNGKITAESETIRGLLHSIAGCAGAAATGGDCASAAAGSAATVALNNLIAAKTENMTAEQKQAYSNLMGTLVAGVASGVGGDAAAAQLASKIEVENNFLTRADAAQYASSLKACNGNSACEDEARKKAIQAYQRNEAALELAKLRGDLKAYNALLATAASSSEIPFDGTAMFRNKADAVSGGANLEQERDIKYIAGIRSSRCSGLSINACDNVVYEQLSKDGKQAATFLGSALTAGAGGALVQAVGGVTKAAAVGASLGVASNGAAQYAYNRDSNKGFFENISNLDKTDLAVAGVTGALGVRYKLFGNIMTNEGGYVASKTLNGEDVTLAGAGATALGTTLGYGFGKYAPSFLAPYVSQTLRPGLTKLDPTKSILFQMKPQTAILTKKLPAWTKPLPALGGTVGAPTLQEFSTPVFEKGINWLDRKRVFP